MTPARLMRSNLGMAGHSNQMRGMPDQHAAHLEGQTARAIPGSAYGVGTSIVHVAAQPPDGGAAVIAVKCATICTALSRWS